MLWSLLKLVFVSLPVLIFSAIVGFLAWNYRRDRWLRCYRMVASKYSAFVDVYGFRPRMRFNYSDSPASLFSHGVYFGNRQPCTVLQVELNSSGLAEFQALPRFMESYFKGKRGYETVLANDAFLDENFSFRSTDKEFAASILSEQLSSIIREMYVRFPGELLTIDLNAKRLRISRSGYVFDEVSVADFLRFTLKIVDLLQLSKVEGIQFSSEVESAVKPDAHCPICSERPNRAVVCYSCKTPHCRECWEYNGKCGMFACGETRYVKSATNDESNA
jgi:hypothetical protein